MKVLVDENIPRITVEELKRLGYDVRDVRSTGFEGIPDTELWQIAQEEKRLLITTDKGFSQYRGTRHSGILIIRLRQPNCLKIHQRIMYALNHFSESAWQGLIVTMRDKTMHVYPADRT